MLKGKNSLFQELNGDAQHKLRGLYQNYFYGRQDQAKTKKI